MKKEKLHSAMAAAMMLFTGITGTMAQTEIYPHHFALDEVTLTGGPLKKAMDINIELLMKYDVDRLLTPFIRQSGLASTTDSGSRYYKWESKHPSFTNWGGSNFNLDGHVGGHYLTALALAYAACHDDDTRAAVKERLDYMIGILKDCQEAYDNNTKGLYGFIGGQPINEAWTNLYKGDASTYRSYGGWVPFYCEHKIFAGLRDVYLYTGDMTAKELFRKFADWSTNVVNALSESDMQSLLDIEHGGMNETLADAYKIFGEKKYLTAAKKYSHQTMVNGMQTLSTTFLDNKHANTQVPKYIGFERIAQEDATATTYDTAAKNFWTDVADNRTVCIGGNSVSEHFLPASKSNRYIDRLDGPESCNSNNMLKLSEILSDATHDAKYADFYEYTTWNHILSTQDPSTGGYVYFTTLRPQGYRIYSQVNQGMWCCVGTGMENHSKYGHFIYTRDGSDAVYVNLFTASILDNKDFKLTQETNFPYEQQTKITVGKSGSYTVAIRHPQWTTEGFTVSVNGEQQSIDVTQGKASYVKIYRQWSEGDVITVSLPMALKYVECPNYTDYIAFTYGPILLGAATSADNLQNEYAGEGRMDHAPGSMATSLNLTTAPLLIGERNSVMSRISDADPSTLTFTIDCSRENAPTYKWDKLTLKPFYDIHHSRYMCYWYQQTAENYANSTMAKTEAANEALLNRTVDFVAPGEQQSEAGHEYSYSTNSTKGSYNGESYRDALTGGYVQYSLFNTSGTADSLSILCRFTTADHGRKAVMYVDGTKLADIVIPSSMKNSENGFYNIEYAIPASLAVDSEGNPKTKFVVRFEASQGTVLPGLYYLRLMKGFKYNDYTFVAREWVTGDEARVAQSNISYDDDANVITVKATGNNNVCLALDHEDCDYTVTADKIYLLVRGDNLSTADGKSYLWWLNGVNKGSQVKPTVVKTITLDSKRQQIVAWDMTKSGLYSSFSMPDRNNVCQGVTIFGLTANGGMANIYDINFCDDVDEYVNTTLAVSHIYVETADPDCYYSLSGMKSPNPHHGINIVNTKKVIIK